MGDVVDFSGITYGKVAIKDVLAGAEKLLPESLMIIGAVQGAVVYSGNIEHAKSVDYESVVVIGLTTTNSIYYAYSEPGLHEALGLVLWLQGKLQKDFYVPYSIHTVRLQGLLKMVEVDMLTTDEVFMEGE